MTELALNPPLPEIKSITRDDVRDALRAGLHDFRRAPAFGLFFGAVFSVIGVAIALMLFRGEETYWIFPLAAGFPLIGPFAAVGLYEVSRRLESGEKLAPIPILLSGFRQTNSQLSLFAFFTVFVFLVWILLARLIFALSFGTSTMTNILTSFDMFFTVPGLTMLVFGTVVGAAVAALLFSVSVVAVPLLLDRDIDVVTAMITSFNATLENRDAMLFWAGIVAAASVVAMLPLFLGMVFVFPVLGHATWHIYRRMLGREA